MNKRKVALTSLLGFTLLFGCSQVEGERDLHVGGNKVSAEEFLPEAFIEVQKSDVGGHGTIKFKDVDTGCYYIRTRDVQAVAMVQMFIEKDGVSVPYCDK